MGLTDINIYQTMFTIETSAVATGPSPTCQSNITCETNNNHL